MPPLLQNSAETILNCPIILLQTRHGIIFNLKKQKFTNGKSIFTFQNNYILESSLV